MVEGKGKEVERTEGRKGKGYRSLEWEAGEGERTGKGGRRVGRACGRHHSGSFAL